MQALSLRVSRVERVVVEMQARTSANHKRSTTRGHFASPPRHDRHARLTSLTSHQLSYLHLNSLRLYETTSRSSSLRQLTARSAWPIRHTQCSIWPAYDCH